MIPEPEPEPASYPAFEKEDPVDELLDEPVRRQIVRE